MSDNGADVTPALPERKAERRYPCGCLVRESNDLWLLQTDELLLYQCNNCKRIWNIKFKAKVPESRIVKPF